MSDRIRSEVTHGVAVVTIDNPPVNALGPGVSEGIEAAVTAAIADPRVDAIVLTGAGEMFVAGTDIKVFQTLKTLRQSVVRSEERHAWLKRLEDSPKPLVAAIAGCAFGGGLELALACHYRIATAEAMLGQPEVTLGIFPGAGGTQRLPRLCGVDVALELCTGGKPIDASRALAAGLLDYVAIGPLLDESKAFARARAAAREVRRTREVPIPTDAESGRHACETCRNAIAKTVHGVRAPFAAIDAIEAGLTGDFESGSKRERELFAECVISAESRALVYLFFAEREAAKPPVPKNTTVRAISRIAVIGAGTMGAGIAMAFANSGMPVLLKDTDQAALDRGMATVRKNYESFVSRRKMTKESMDETVARITPTIGWDSFDRVDLVVEAVFEDMTLKQAVFSELGRETRADAILASNTSTLDIDACAEASGRPESVVGLHFFSPAHIMKLLEIVRGRATSPEVLATSAKLARRLGKVGVFVGNAFGFVGNRLLAYYRREACQLLEEGASASQIDAALVKFGMPMGPFAMQDLAGIDIAMRAKQYLASLGRSSAEGPVSDIPDQLYEMGRYGQKTGAGWYRYEGSSRAAIADRLIDELAAEAAAKRGLVRRAIDDDEIVARIMIAMANEGARVIEEGLVTRAGDIDVIYVHGYGYPRYRGGPMFYADTIGLPVVVRKLGEYRARFGEHWKPAPLLEHLAAEGRSFTEAAS